MRKALHTHGGRALVVTDSVFSVDGDAAPLAALADACRAAGAALLVDDAHGLGVLGEGGRGALAAAGLAGGEGVVATLTLSKSLGSQGGAVLGPARVIQHLVNTARTFIFDTGLAPAAAGAALGALRLLRREPGRAARAGAVAAELHGRLHRGRTDSGTPRRRRGVGPRPFRGVGGALGRRLPRRGSRGGMLPAAVGAGRDLPAAADRPRRPDAGSDHGRRGHGRRDGATARQLTGPPCSAATKDVQAVAEKRSCGRPVSLESRTAS